MASLRSGVDSWRRFWRLSPQEKSWFLQAAVWLPLTGLGIRWMGLRRWMSFLEHLPAPAISTHDALPPDATARMVAAAARRIPFSSNCLQRSVVLWWLFRCRGFAAKLWFGSRKEGDLLEAHAWVDLDGRRFDVSEAAPTDFMPFDRPVASGQGKPQ